MLLKQKHQKAYQCCRMKAQKDGPCVAAAPVPQKGQEKPAQEKEKRSGIKGKELIWMDGHPLVHGIAEAEGKAACRDQQGTGELFHRIPHFR